MKTATSEMKLYQMGVRADNILQKKNISELADTAIKKKNPK